MANRKKKKQSLKQNRNTADTPGSKNARSTVAKQAETPGWLLGLLIFLMASPAIVGPYGQKLGYTPDLHMGSYMQVYSFALLGIVLFVLRKHSLKLARAPAIVPLTLLYFLSIVSLFWVHSYYEAVTTVLDYTNVFVVAVLILLLVKDLRWIRNIIAAMVVSGFLVAALGILQFLFDVEWVHQQIPPAATFSNKNLAGQYMLLVFPLAIIAMFDSRKWQATWFYVLATVFIATYIFFTRSRAVWLGAAFEMLVLLIALLYILIGRRHNFIDTIHKKLAVVGGVFAILVGTYLSPNLLNIESTAGNEGTSRSGWSLIQTVFEGGKISGLTRARIWANSVPMFIDNAFLGVGVGNWTVHYARYQSWIQQDVLFLHNQYHANAHNDYIELFCELGIVGALLFLLAVIGILRMMGALLFSRKLDPGESLVFLALTVSIIGLAVDAVFSFPLKRPVQLMLLGAYIALLAVGYSTFINKKTYSFGGSTVVKKSMATVALTLSAGLLYFNYNLLQSEYHYRAAAIATKKPGQDARVIRSARKAQEYNPLRVKLKWYEGVASMNMGRTSKAVSLLEQVLANYPYSLDTTLSLSKAYYKLKQYDKAAEGYGSLVHVQEARNKTTLLYLKSLEKSGQYKKMREGVEKVLPLYYARRDLIKMDLLSKGVTPFRSDAFKKYNKNIKTLGYIHRKASAYLAGEDNFFPR